jgi:hypothetical protein
MVKAKCKECGFSGPVGKFPFALEVQHDLKCPECGSTNIDTSDLLEKIPGYSYGANNTRRMRIETKGG